MDGRLSAGEGNGGDTARPLQVIILDVGHGNSAIVRDGTKCAVVDTGTARQTTTVRELDRIGCTRIEHLIISHSDEDHVGGAPRLLLDESREIGILWFNSDGQKNTKAWEHFLRSAHMRRRRGGLGAVRDLHTAIDQHPSFGRVSLEIAHPSILFAGRGPTPPGKHIPGFGRLETNSLSVVLRVLLDGEPAALLAADMDAVALAHIKDEGSIVTAPILVFPHHGGLPGKCDPQDFARQLAELVEPELVIFSIKSGINPSNPHPDILSGVRQGAPRAHIACTQLSVHCHAAHTTATDWHLAEGHASGRDDGRCCAGSVTISSVDGGLLFDPPLDRHRVFIDEVVLIEP
jgi:hypothetical protein